MHIAILFYGRINKYTNTFLLNSLPQNHTYDVFYSADLEPNELLDDFIKIYKPISVNNDKISYDVDFGKYPNTKTHLSNIHNMTCHFINKKRVFNLLENYINLTNTKYDIIIATRLDLFIDTLTLDIPLPNTIYIPKNEDHTGINDRFAMGDFQTMKKYMNIYDNCVYLLENKISVAHPENLTLYNIEYYKLNIVRFDINYSIMR
jgi:hypothetical protein